MINFSQYLTEARMAPLFHATRPEAADKIIQTNMFTGRRSHEIKGIKSQYRVDNYTPDTLGVSFSRSRKAASNFGWHDKGLNTLVIFEIDQSKLSANNKIMPMNYMGNHYAGSRFLNVARTQRDDARDKEDTSHFYANEYEEYVLGNIKNVDKMIIKIHVMSPLTEDNIRQNLPDLWYHPKLFNSTNAREKGDFYNNKRGS